MVLLDWLLFYFDPLCHFSVVSLPATYPKSPKPPTPHPILLVSSCISHSKLIGLWVLNQIVNDSDSKPSEFDHQLWLLIMIQIQFQWPFWVDDRDFDWFLIKFTQFWLNLTNFWLKDWKIENSIKISKKWIKILKKAKFDHFRIIRPSFITIDFISIKIECLN